MGSRLWMLKTIVTPSGAKRFLTLPPEALETLPSPNSVLVDLQMQSWTSGGMHSWQVASLPFTTVVGGCATFARASLICITSH